MSRHVVSALGFALLAGCTAPASNTSDASAPPPAAAVDPVAVRSSIDAANANFLKAMNAGDVAGMMVNYAENAVSMQPNMPAMNGKAAMTQGMTDMLKTMTFSNATASTTDVIVSGDLAVETGIYIATVTPKGGKAMTDTSKYVTVWQKQADGSYKIIRDIFNSNLPVK